MSTKKLPVGVEDFAEIRKQNFYYIDKTGLIRDLLQNWAKVNLFTRPRRFGKSLNMSMLKSFFETGTDPELFHGLSISKETELCDEYMGKYPTIFLTLKDVDGLTFENAKNRLVQKISNEAERFRFLLNSSRLTANEKEMFRSLTTLEKGLYCMDDDLLSNSLQILSGLLYQHYNQKVILLIDEYDVPLDKAFQHGYYSEMVALIRGFLGQALKSNPFLQFSVLTGCLRISKESIFTGLNNFRILSITDPRFDEHFGFTETEAAQLLKDYHLENHMEEAKEWYDGYRFGDTHVYCPWDLINYVDRLSADPMAEPETFWINTSGNDLVKRFIDKADKTTQNEIERLIAGESIAKKIRLDLTYNELDSSIENLWSVLFTTGYLTQRERESQGIYNLIIPNREVLEVFVSQIQEWFRETTHADTARIYSFCEAFTNGDAETIQNMLNDYLWDSISVRDTAIRKNMKENFYHGLLLGLLRSQGSWLIHSNAETGNGYSDISIATPQRTGMIIEIKYADDGNMKAACDKAMNQIEEKKYTEILKRQGMKHIICYGIAFYQKECMVCKRN